MADQTPAQLDTAIIRIVKLIIIGLLLLPFTALHVSAQRTTPAGGPNDSAARMYGLEDIYDRVDTGASPSLPASFTEPTAGPGTASGINSINSLISILPEVDDTDCASPDQVLLGTTFFSLCTSTWGSQTGTASADPILAATGQNTCYDASGNVISCAGTGQDGEYQLGDTASPRFTDNSDGTVTDNLTGLIWLKNANCSATLGGVAKTTTLVWADALTWSNNMANGSCGLSDGSVAGDWRLPNINELASLIDYQVGSAPRIPSGHPFSSVQSSLYWSSTSYRPRLSSAWVVNFTTGNTDSSGKTDFYVWPVR